MRTLGTLAIAFSLSAAGPAVADNTSNSNALSGMNSTSAAIDQASNNIANANTTGAPKSGASATDVMATRAGNEQPRPASAGHRR